MGCGCGANRRPATTAAALTPSDGDWVSQPPGGAEPVVFTGPSARRRAQRHAIATGGTWYRHTESTSENADGKAV